MASNMNEVRRGDVVDNVKTTVKLRMNLMLKIIKDS